MSTNALVQTYTNLVEFSPANTAAAYSAGDQLGTVLTLSGAFSKPYVYQLSRGNLLGGVIVNCGVVDLDKKELNLYVHIFQNSPTLASGDNDAFDLTDANMVAAKRMTTLEIVATDYITLTSQSVADSQFSRGVNAAADSKDLYAVVQTADAVTFTTASALKFFMGILLD